MYKKTLLKSLLGLSCSLPAIAGGMGDINTSPALPSFYVGLSGGYGTVDGAYAQDGQVAQGRLSFGAHVKEYKHIIFGGELGLQSGNTMRLNSPSVAIIDAAGGLPIQATLKPLIDALITAKYQFEPARPLFAMVKGGIAYRQLTLQDRASSQDSLSKVNGEFQAGFGYNLTDHLILSAMYQGIYSTGNAGINLDRAGDITISRIPTQQAGFLGVEYSFF